MLSTMEFSPQLGKCHFMAKKGHVHVHIVSSEWIEVDKVKVEFISKLPIPKIIKDVYSLLGQMGF